MADETTKIDAQFRGPGNEEPGMSAQPPSSASPPARPGRAGKAIIWVNIVGWFAVAVLLAFMLAPTL